MFNYINVAIEQSMYADILAIHHLIYYV